MYNLNNWVIVFDIDDTIISENEYKQSGIKAIEKMLNEVYDINTNNKIICAHRNGTKDLLAFACDEFKLSESIKESMLWVYRLHRPKISIYSGLEKIIKKLIAMEAKLAFLSDGRSFSQRLKLNSIGLQNFPLYISEDYVDEKPGIKRFLAIQRRWPGYNYSYIADNSSKDFDAPRQLNWLAIGANWVKDRIHPINKKGIQPEEWLNNPDQIIPCIINRDKVLRKERI